MSGYTVAGNSDLYKTNNYYPDICKYKEVRSLKACFHKSGPHWIYCINTCRSMTFKDFILLQNGENVKITPQNSTDYVKSLCKNNRICDLQIANLCISIVKL